MQHCWHGRLAFLYQITLLPLPHHPPITLATLSHLLEALLHELGVQLAGLLLLLLQVLDCSLNSLDGLVLGLCGGSGVLGGVGGGGELSA